VRSRLAETSLLAVLLASGCSDGGHELLVQVKTDLVPGIEFATVRAEAFTHGRQERDAMLNDDFIAGIRVAEYDGLASGDYVVQVELLDAMGAVVMARLTRLSLSSDYGLTVLMTRDCAGVTCPGSGDPATATACLGGRCVDETCSPEAPASCPAPECMADGDCAATAACATGRCIEGACFVDGDDTSCGAGSYCDVETGCAPLPGVGDAGMDTGVDDTGVGDTGGDTSGGACLPGPIYARDTFTDANGTALAAHVMDVGTGWTPLSGGGRWTIQSSQLSIGSGGTGEVAVVETCQSDVVIRATIPARTELGVAFRVEDAGNFAGIFVDPGFETVHLSQYADGMLSTSMSQTISFATDRELRVQIQGVDLNVFYDGMLVLTDTVADTGATRHGIFIDSNTGVVDDFVVEAVP